MLNSRCESSSESTLLAPPPRRSRETGNSAKSIWESVHKDSVCGTMVAVYLHGEDNMTELADISTFNQLQAAQNTRIGMPSGMGVTIGLKHGNFNTFSENTCYFPCFFERRFHVPYTCMGGR